MSYLFTILISNQNDEKRGNVVGRIWFDFGKFISNLPQVFLFFFYCGLLINRVVNRLPIWPCPLPFLNLPVSAVKWHPDYYSSGCLVFQTFFFKERWEIIIPVKVFKLQGIIVRDRCDKINTQTGNVVTIIEFPKIDFPFPWRKIEKTKKKRICFMIIDISDIWTILNLRPLLKICNVDC